MKNNPLIMAIGNFKRHAYAIHWQGIRQGFEQIEGIDVTYRDFREAVGADCFDNRFRPGTDRAVADMIRKDRPDVVLFGIQDAMTDPVMDAVRDVGAFAALWFCDIRDPETRPRLGDDLGLLAMTNVGLGDRYAESWSMNRDDIVWLPQGCLPDICPVYDESFAADIAFVGSYSHIEYHADRREVFSYLETRFGVSVRKTAQDPRPGSFVVYFPETDGQKANVTAKLPEVYGSAKISIGVSVPIVGYHSNRLFLSTGHGAVYFCNWFEGLDVLFEPNEEVLVFDPEEPESFMDLLEKWTKPSAFAERSEIRRKAWERVQAEHTYKERIKVLWESIQSRR